MENNDGPMVVTPERKTKKGPSKKLSDWQAAYEFTQKPFDRKKLETSSRLRKTPDRIASFQRKKDIAALDAPNLSAVVNAKPEIKRKAHAEVEKRVKKTIEKFSEHKKKTKADKKSEPTTTQRGENNKGKAFANADGKTIKCINPGFDHQNQEWAVVRPMGKTVGRVLKKPTKWKPIDLAPSPKKEGKKKAAEGDDKKASPLVQSPFKSPKKKSRRPKAAPANLAPPLVDDANDEASDKPSLDAAPSSSKEPTEAAGPVSALSPAPIEPKEPPASSDESGDKGKGPLEKPLSDEDVVASNNALLDPSEQSESSNEWEPASPFVNPSPKQLVLEFALDLHGDGEKHGLEVPVKVYSLDDMSSFGVPSIQSDDSYDTRMNKMMQRWVDLQGDEEESENDEDRTVYNNDVDLDDNVLDHIVFAAPDLELAMQQFEDMTGIKPTLVGPLQGLGVCTAHVGLDHSRYIVILAPDKENDGPLGDDLRTLSEGTLTPYHYAIRSSEVSRLVEGYISDVLGWNPDHIAIVQALPDASLRQWDLLTMYGHGVGGIAPSYVKWKKAETHPSVTIALKAKLKTCMIRAPENHDVFKLITDVDGITTGFGELLLEVSVETPNGTITFSSNYPKGLIFPGYDDENHRSRQCDFAGIPELLLVEGDYSDLEEDYDENDFDVDDEGK